MQELAFYTFKNGKKFYPDFIMLLENNKNEQFQILLESKGEHLVLVEAEKQDFLAKLDKTAKPTRQEKIKILGLKFFTQNNHKFFDNLSKKIF
jgi:type III restriction enzyme